MTAAACIRGGAAAVLLALLVDGSIVGAAQTADLALLEAVREVGARLVRDGVPESDPPLAVRADVATLAAASAARLRALGSPETLDARGRAWADLGLGVGDGPARLAEVLAADLDGLGIDHDGHRLLVAGDLLPEGDFAIFGPDDADAQLLLATGVRPDEPVIAHALLHLLDPSPLGRDPSVMTTDAMLAWSALAEGEANVFAVRYLFRSMGLADEVVALGIDPAEVIDGRLVPADLGRRAGTVDDLLQFVYRDGYETVAERFRVGGIAAVRALRRNAVTTRDVLHPDRVGSAVRTFGDVVLRGSGRVVDRDRLGEQGVVVLISRGTGKDNLALMAGDGWAGDELVRWEDPDDARAAVTVWSTAWVRDEDAKDFAYSYRRLLATRFPGAVPDDVNEDDLRVVREGRVWTVRRDGDIVRVTIGPAAPNPG